MVGFVVVRGPVSRVFFFVCLLSFTSCRDEAAEAFARAQMQNRALIDQAVPPTDPRFDAVLLDLRKVPPSSRHAEPAQKLIRAIELGRGHTVRTPLALGAKGRRAPLLEAKLAACAQLAVLAGADGGLDHRTMVALEQCRREAEELELRFSHPEEYADGGEHDHP